MSAGRSIAFSLLLLCAPSLFAAAWGVTNTADTPVGQACAGFTGCSLREAVTSTEVNPGPDAILVSGGTYSLTNGPLQITQSLTISKVGSSTVTIDAGSSSRILVISGGGTDVIIRFLTLSHGLFSGGAGVGQGGAIFAGAGTTLSVESTIISNNSVSGTDAEGGAIYSLGSVTVQTASGSPTGSELASNSATASSGTARGGAITVMSGSLAIAARSFLHGNTASGPAAQGGAVSVRSLASPSTIDQALLSSNAANGNPSTGGGLSVESSEADVTFSTFSSNSVQASSSTASGGAIGAVGSAATISVTTSTLASNSAQATGTAAGRGGAIYNSSTTANATTIRRSTVTSNSLTGTGSAGGALSGDPVAASAWLIAASIVSGNSLPECSSATIVSGDNNLIGTGCLASPGANDVVTGTPALNALGNNGGLTPTVSLQVTSPARDLLPPASADCTAAATDQRGVSRPYGAGCDAGAFEATNFPPTLTATGGTPTFTEDGPFVDLFSGATIDTVGSGQNILSISLSVANLGDGAAETLNVDGTNVALTNLNSVTTGTNGMTVSVSVAGSTANVTISKAAGVAPAIAASIVDGLTYGNLSEAPTGSSRVVTLTSIQDDGGTANGGSDTTTLNIPATVTIVAVNDAPVNTVPGPQTTAENTNIIFDAAHSNLISVGDVDAGTGAVRVSLAATNGLIDLATTAGLSFVTGSGSNDANVTFDGTLVNVNAALNGLVFKPASGFFGAASLQITTDDRGLTGSGGTLTDADTINITVTPGPPVVTNVDSTNADGLYHAGDVIAVTVTFDQPVIVTGTPLLQLETGTIDRQALYTSGSGSNTLTFSYTVQAGDETPHLDYTSTGALTTNGGLIRNAGSIDATLTLPSPGAAGSLGANSAIAIDTTAPFVTSVDVPPPGTYTAGQSLDFTVHFDELVIVAGGTPSIPLTIGTSIVQAQYVSGSGTAALHFRYTVNGGDRDGDGISAASSISLNGATIRDAASNDALLALNGMPSTAAVLVVGPNNVPALSNTAFLALFAILGAVALLRMRS